MSRPIRTHDSRGRASDSPTTPPRRPYPPPPAPPPAHLFVVVVVELADGAAHAEAHLDGAARVVGARLRAARHAVVAVAERADLLAAVPRAQLVEAAEQVVEQAHQQLRRLVRRHLREADDVGEQDRHVVHLVHVEVAELQLAAAEPRRGAAAAAAPAARPALLVLAVLAARLHHLLGDLRRHQRVDHLALQLLLDLEVVARHDRLADLRGGTKVGMKVRGVKATVIWGHGQAETGSRSGREKPGSG